MFDQLTCEKGLTSCPSCDLLSIMTHVLARLHAYTVHCVSVVGDACDWLCISHQCSPATWRSEPRFSEVCKSVSGHEFRWGRGLWNFLTKVYRTKFREPLQLHTLYPPKAEWMEHTHSLPHTYRSTQHQTHRDTMRRPRTPMWSLLWFWFRFINPKPASESVVGVLCDSETFILTK